MKCFILEPLGKKKNNLAAGVMVPVLVEDNLDDLPELEVKEETEAAEEGEGEVEEEVKKEDLEVKKGKRSQKSWSGLESSGRPNDTNVLGFSTGSCVQGPCPSPSPTGSVESQKFVSWGRWHDLELQHSSFGAFKITHNKKITPN